MRSGKEEKRKRDSLVCFSDNNFFGGKEVGFFFGCIRAITGDGEEEKVLDAGKIEEIRQEKKNPECCFNGIEHVCRSLYKREKLLSP